MKIERYLTQDDAAKLSRLAEQLLRVREVRFNAAESLIELISTSILLPENVQRPDCVSLYSRVKYRHVDSDDVRSIEIVCPHDASDTLARVSILAPLAMALIGRPKNSIVEVHLPFNKVQFIEILDVHDFACAARELAGPEESEVVG